MMMDFFQNFTILGNDYSAVYKKLWLGGYAAPLR